MTVSSSGTVLTVPRPLSSLSSDCDAPTTPAASVTTTASASSLLVPPYRGQQHHLTTNWSYCAPMFPATFGINLSSSSGLVSLPKTKASTFLCTTVESLPESGHRAESYALQDGHDLLLPWRAILVLCRQAPSPASLPADHDHPYCAIC